MSKKESPKYHGIKTYRDPKGRFMFRYPSDWVQHELTDDRDGTMYAPQAENPTTWFAVWAAFLQTPIVAEDIDVLREGVKEGLSQLDSLNIESESQRILGNLCKFECVYTFKEDGNVRKRRVIMLYVHTWAIAIIAQGGSVEDYHYWLPMLNDCFNSFDLSHSLWYASDRDLMSREAETK